MFSPEASEAGLAPVSAGLRDITPDGAYERVFSINVSREGLAKAIGQGMTLALSMARAEWENPTPDRGPQTECVIIPFPPRRH